MYPGLADVAPYVTFYRTTEELMELVEDRISQGARSAHRLKAAQTLVATEHSTAKRLRQIVDTVRRRRKIHAARK
jgi:hypothetical protein